MITQDMISAFADMAGADFSWSGTRGGHRPTAKLREPMRADWLTRQGGICPVCGDPVVNGETNHVVSQGPSKRGYFPGNVFNGCASCNTRCEREYGAIIPVIAFARPDVIPMEWTPKPVLRMSHGIA